MKTHLRKSVLIPVSVVLVLALLAGTWFLVLRNPVGYAYATRMMERASYEPAARGFEALGDYRDAPELAKVARFMLEGQKIEVLFKSGRFDEAEAALSGLEATTPAFDARMLICDFFYRLAKSLYGQGSYFGAMLFFRCCGDYLDSREWALKSDQMFRVWLAELIESMKPTLLPTPTPTGEATGAAAPTETPTPLLSPTPSLSPTPIPTPVPTVKPTLPATPPFDGAGTLADPYLIRSTSELEQLRDGMNSGNAQYTGKAYRLANDLDLAGSPEEPWTPIGLDLAHPFLGSFDGNGHRIAGLVIVVATTNSGESFHGLFGVNNGTIGHLAVLAPNLRVTGTSNSFIGGICGLNEGTIRRCSTSEGGIGGYRAGGIAGTNGRTGLKSGTIEDSYGCTILYGDGYTGTDSGGVRLGGIVGVNGALGTVRRCYGAAPAFMSYGGGISGVNDGTFASCYYSGSAQAGTYEGTDTAVSCMGSSMQQQSTFTGFDFSTVWVMPPDASTNNGYPVLR